MIQISILIILISILVIIAISCCVVGIKYIDVKYLHRPVEPIVMTESQLLLKNLDAYFKIRDLFIKEIKELVASELNQKIIIDKMANSHSISTEEIFSQIDNILEKLYAVFPVSFMKVITELYTAYQIRLLVTNEVADFSRSYYKIFESRKREGVK